MCDVTASATAMDKDKTTSDKSQTSSKKQREQAPASLNMNELRELAELVNEHGFTDFEFENENIRVRLSKMTAAPVRGLRPAAGWIGVRARRRIALQDHFTDRRYILPLAFAR